MVDVLSGMGVVVAVGRLPVNGCDAQVAIPEKKFATCQARWDQLQETVAVATEFWA